MNAFEHMMSNLPRLRHLELVSHCDNDVIDGHRWHKKVNKLDTFNFMFYISDELQSRKLDSFRTPFWLNKKRWYVAYTDGLLFSVPHFIQTEVNGHFRLPRYRTISGNKIFYENIQKLSLTKALSRRNIHFPRVQKLELRFVPDLSTLMRIVDLRQVQQLTLSSVENISALQSWINRMPNLCEISIETDVKKFIEHVHYKRSNQIRTLRLGNYLTRVDDWKIEDLCIAFPYLECLEVNFQCSIEQVINVLRRFKYLSIASFPCAHWYEGTDHFEQYYRIVPTLNEIRQIHGLNCTYRFDSSMIFFWILSQLNQHRI